MTKHTESGPQSWMWQQALWPSSGDSMELAFDAYVSWLDGWWQAQDESLRFCRDCMSRSLDAATSLAASRTPAEALAVQMRYAADAVGDWLVEGKRLLNLAGKAALQAAAPLEEGARHASH